ncbi:UNKNOWN [Stylonychia lemnae]|uniref:Uncharacterized protein n=1 Tax=Stylonychia lemnae TaxID=5949 RepID=A0A078AAY8_STYLE|nr:UNKNOWN [Stylonychia lemnae]|eukprot:CDW77958.1 UNKNOWN [Stylonychia lemnae]
MGLLAFVVIDNYFQFIDWRVQLNSTLGVIVVILICTSPILIFIFLFKNRTKLHSSKMESRYGSLYEKYIQDAEIRYELGKVFIAFVILSIFVNFILILYQIVRQSIKISKVVIKKIKMIKSLAMVIRIKVDKIRHQQLDSRDSTLDMSQSVSISPVQNYSQVNSGRTTLNPDEQSSPIFPPKRRLHDRVKGIKLTERNDMMKTMRIDPFGCDDEEIKLEDSQRRIPTFST